jgi:hypothetical protein
MAGFSLFAHSFRMFPNLSFSAAKAAAEKLLSTNFLKLPA